MATVMAELITRGDAEALRMALQEEPGRVDERDERERTPLHLAAAAGRADLVEVLLSCGADPNAGDAHDYPAINQAAWNGHEAVIALLVEHLEPGGDPAAALLSMLAQRGHRDCVARLLARGVPVDLDDGIGQTPLIHALRKGHAGVATLLLEHGARVDVAVGADSTTPLALARQAKLADVVTAIEARVGPASAGATTPPSPAPPPVPTPGPVADRLPGAKPLTLAAARTLLRGVHAFPGGKAGQRLFVWEGDTYVAGNLLLDAGELVVVTGALTVEGALIDCFLNEDDTSRLFVLGDLRVQTLITGSPIHVGGDLVVGEILYANSFGLDTLTVKGRLTAPVLIDEGHEIDAGQLDVGRVFAAAGQLPPWREVVGVVDVAPLAGDVFVEPSLYARGFIDARALFERAVTGAAIVKPPPSAPPRSRRRR